MPHPFSRDAELPAGASTVDQASPELDTAVEIGSSTHGERSLPTDATGVPGAATTRGHAPQRTPAEFVHDLGTGLLGAVLAGIYGALLNLAGLSTALNNDRPSRAAFVVLALPLVAAAAAATAVLIRRARAVRAQGVALDAVHALAVGAGVFVSTYGVFRVLTAVLGEGSAALAP